MKTNWLTERLQQSISFSARQTNKIIAIINKQNVHSHKLNNNSPSANYHRICAEDGLIRKQTPTAESTLFHWQTIERTVFVVCSAARRVALETGPIKIFHSTEVVCLEFLVKVELDGLLIDACSLFVPLG